MGGEVALLALLIGSAVANAGEPERMPPAVSDDVGRVADMIWPTVVPLREPNGQLGAFDDLLLSVRGDSWTWTRYHWEGLEITDPARPGQPMLRFPAGWGAQLGELADFTPVVGWTGSPSPEPLLAWANLWGGGHVGGSTWVPQRLMDREPALRTGATPQRRGVEWGGGVSGGGAMPLPSGRWELWLDHRRQTQRFPTLVDGRGNLVPELAERTTVASTVRLRWGTLPVHAQWALQQEGRRAEGASERWPSSLTRPRSAWATALRAGATLPVGAERRLQLQAGWTWRRDEHTAIRSPVVTDLERQWTWLQPYTRPVDLERHRFDVRAALVGKGPSSLRWDLSAWGAQVRRQDRGPQLQGWTFLRDPWAPAAYMQVLKGGFDAPRHQQLGGAQLRATQPFVLLGGGGRLFGELDIAAVGVNGERRWSDLALAAGGRWGWNITVGELWADVHSRPVPLNPQVADFVAAPPGVTYRWNDDGDGVPELGEEGSVAWDVGRHHLPAGLSRPRRTALELGWRSPQWGPVRVSLLSYARMLTGRWSPRWVGPQYRTATVIDPGGDGLGERPGPDGVIRLPVFERVNAGGSESVELRAAREVDLYGGLGLRVDTVGTRWWYLHLAFDAFMSQGSGAFGWGPYRNDPGVIDADSADPNHRIHARGRYDHDRAFRASLNAGITAPTGWLRGLRVGTQIRYRDGEPITRFYGVELPQGPTVLMTVPRGAPVPRLTFKLAVDLRASYELTYGPWLGAMELAILNVTGSGTELGEYLSTGDNYRRSLEMVAGRSVWLGVSLGWR